MVTSGGFWRHGNQNCRPPADLLAHARKLAAPFPGALPKLVAATEADHVQRWPIRDRVAAQALVHGSHHPRRRCGARHLAIRGLRRRDVHQRRLLRRADARGGRPPRHHGCYRCAADLRDPTNQAHHRAGPAGLHPGQGVPPHSGAAPPGQRLRPRPPPSCRSRWANAVRARSSPNSTRWAKESPRAGNDASTDERRGRMQG